MSDLAGKVCWPLGRHGGVEGESVFMRQLCLVGDAGGVCGGDWRGAAVERRLTRLVINPTVVWWRRSVSSCLCSNEIIRCSACSSLWLCWGETVSISLYWMFLVLASKEEISSFSLESNVLETEEE